MGDLLTVVVVITVMTGVGNSLVVWQMPSRGRRLAPHRKAHDLVSHVGDLDRSERDRIARATPTDVSKEV